MIRSSALKPLFGTMKMWARWYRTGTAPWYCVFGEGKGEYGVIDWPQGGTRSSYGDEAKVPSSCEGPSAGP